MNNGEFYTMMDGRLARLEDKVDNSVKSLSSNMNDAVNTLSEKVDRLVSERNAICTSHDDRIDKCEQSFAVIRDRQTQSESRTNKLLTIITVVWSLIAGGIGMLLQRK